jgi:hypothetical protein
MGLGGWRRLLLLFRVWVVRVLGGMGRIVGMMVRMVMMMVVRVRMEGVVLGLVWV